MARTATKTAPDPALETPELTLETIPVTNPEADIRNMVITIAATNNPDQLPGGAMTADQANDYIRPWLEQGFKTQSAQVIQAGDVNGIYTLQVYYCLVK
jgi:hypothetical protein